MMSAKTPAQCSGFGSFFLFRAHFPRQNLVILRYAQLLEKPAVGHSCGVLWIQKPCSQGGS